MKTIVKKFGGTSVGDIQRIKNVAKLIKEFLEKETDTRLVVVVSAMAGETNKLVALANSCVENPEPRELDVLLATGEQVTIALLSMALVDQGLPAKSLMAQQAKISTDMRHNNAQITDIDTSNLLDTLNSKQIAVVAGFQGVAEDGDVTTLGRGGSDITAVAIAAALKADACYIYTDVEGVFSTDPRVCPHARQLKQICHEEMLEMASLGAKVLHTRSVYFAMRYEVPLVVLSTFNPVPQTWIVKEDQLMEKPLVTGITYRMDEAKITIHNLPRNSRSLDLIFSRLAEEGVFIDMITQSGVSKDVFDLSFTVPDDVSSKALNIAQECIPKIEAEGAYLERDIAKISIVGVGMRYHTGVAAEMFSVLAKENIDVQMIATSEIKLSVLIPRKYGEVAVRALHEAFVDQKPEISVEQ